MDLARPSFGCPATELKSTAECSDGQFHMPSDGDIITVGDERFRCQSIFQAMCWLVRNAKESNCSVIVCGSHVKRVLTRDGGLGSLLTCYS